MPIETGSAAGLILPEHILTFLAEPNYAALATIDPDGAPRSAVIWFRLEPDGRILVNSRAGRRWPDNLTRDPRASLAVIDRADGLRWVGISGRVDAIAHDQPTAQADIAGLARRYHVDDPEKAERMIVDRFSPQTRISFRIRPAAVHDHLE